MIVKVILILKRKSIYIYLWIIIILKLLFLILIKEKSWSIKCDKTYIKILVLLSLNKKSLFLKNIFLVLVGIFSIKLEEIIIYLII